MLLRKALSSESGSLAPLWAIGGLMLVISIFWVENYSWTFLQKYRQMQLANALARASLLENAGSTANLRKLFEASGSSSSNQTFSQVASASTVDEIDSLLNEKRLAELMTVKMKSSVTVDVPFTEVNSNIGIATSASLITSDQTVKVFRPINVILAVESSTLNKASMSRVVAPLSNALQRLIDAAKNSRVSVIPYSYRVNISGKCYTGISRGDNLNFPWWESFFGEDDVLTSLNNSLTTAKNKLSSANSSISSKRASISRLLIEQGEYEKGTPEYDSLQSQITQLNKDISDLQKTLPQLQEDINNAQKKKDTQQEIVDNLKTSDQYIDYLQLAKHYAKRHSNYKYFEDYNDAVANTGIYSITTSHYLSAAKSLTVSPESISKLAVTRNKYFGDTTTCPSSQVSYNHTTASSAKSALNSIDYSATEALSLEGIVWAGRTVYGRSSTLIRDVVFLFISGRDEMNDPDELPGVSSACSTLKSAYTNKIASKLVIVGPDSEAINKFTHLNCPTSWYQDIGAIALDELNGNFSEELESRFTFYLSQESTTKNVNPK